MMNKRSREALAEALASAGLPEGYDTSLPHDDFINWRSSEGRGERVVRVVGPNRHLVLFGHDGQSSSWHRSSSKTYFLDWGNEMVEFDPNTIIAEWKRANGKTTYNWNTVIGGWLTEHEAFAFKGHGWAELCTMKVLNLITRWERHYSNGLVRGPTPSLTA